MTVVAHGLIARDGTLAVWAETDRTGPAGPPARGSAPEHRSARALPGEVRQAILLLPSTSAGPLPSPQLGLPPRRGRPRLRPWRVPAGTVAFVTDDLADEYGARAAPSLAYLAEVCAFAADLVARGRVLPGVHPGGRRP
ncbi:ATP-dependent helicase, partial [Actinoplanes sp. NPDC026623]